LGIDGIEGNLVAIASCCQFLENWQQKNGSIKIPSCLWKYTSFKIIKPKIKTKKKKLRKKGKTNEKKKNK